MVLDSDEEAEEDDQAGDEGGQAVIENLAINAWDVDLDEKDSLTGLAPQTSNGGVSRHSEKSAMIVNHDSTPYGESEAKQMWKEFFQLRSSEPTSFSQAAPIVEGGEEEEEEEDPPPPLPLDSDGAEVPCQTEQPQTGEGI